MARRYAHLVCFASLTVVPVRAAADCPPPDATAGTHRVGLRVGTGVGTATERTLDVSVDAIGAARITHRVFALLHAGWSRRTSVGTERDAIDAGQLAVGGAVQVATSRIAVLELRAGVRGELRFDDRFAGGDVRRGGLDGTAALALVLRRVPLEIGVRVDQGVTPLVDDTRARAIMLDVTLQAIAGGPTCHDTVAVACR